MIANCKEGREDCSKPEKAKEEDGQTAISPFVYLRNKLWIHSLENGAR